MTLIYAYNSQPVAEGERTIVYDGARIFVRTGVQGATADAVTYRLREVLWVPDSAAPINFAVPGGV